LCRRNADRTACNKQDMAARRFAGMLLSRTLNASRAAPRSELHTASTGLLAARQPQQLTTLTRFVASPAASQAARQGSAFVARSYASDGFDSPPLGLKEALKSELEYEHDNYEPDEVLFGVLRKLSTICAFGKVIDKSGSTFRKLNPQQTTPDTDTP